jgi:DNA primase
MSESQRLDDATIELARSARSLVGLVARRVQLRRAGRSWSGLCPFHQEKTPSFSVSEEKGFYHCFGCGAHGSAIDWMMEAEGLGFREAVASCSAASCRMRASLCVRSSARRRRSESTSSAR